MNWISLGIMTILFAFGMWRIFIYCQAKQGWQKRLWILPLVAIAVGIALGIVL